MSETINTTVTNDMRLIISPDQIGREGEHNSAVFKIISQPASLDQYACRAEVQIGGSKTYRLVEDGEFSLTNDITQVSGIGQLQLVYSDGDTVLRKTTQATFHVSGSINAIDPSDPTFQDGLAQLQSAAFTSVLDPPPGTDLATFFNINGSPVAVLRFPPSAVGGDLTEDRANGLYVRLTGQSSMVGSLNFTGPNRGVTWEDSGLQGALYSTGTQLVLRLPVTNPPFLIEDNSGNAGTRTPVITQASGDARYVQPAALDAYLLKAGDVMTGDLRLIPADNIDNPIGITVGGRQASVMWNNALQLRRGLAGEPVQVADVNGGNASQIVTEASGDARYLTPDAANLAYARRDGAQFTGPLITMGGGSLTNPGLAIGENSTGFYRAGSALLLGVSGALYAQYLTAPASLMMTVPLNMAASNPITNLADAVNPQDAVNRRVMDAAIAAAPRPNSRTYIPDPVEIPTGSGAIVFFNQPFPTANNNPRTITITVFPAYISGTPGAFYDLAYTCGLQPLALVEARSAVYPTPNAYMQSPIRFAATVTPVGNQIQVQLSVRELSNNPARISQAGVAADRRSYVTIEEQQN